MCRNPKCAKIRSTITDRKMARPRGWNRDVLVCFFVHKTVGMWAKLPAYVNVSAEARARSEVKGWVIPTGCFGRDVDQSQANSIRAYIRDVIFRAMDETGDAHPDIADVATVLHDGEVTIIRKR